jgi:transmembrane sensor
MESRQQIEDTAAAWIFKRDSGQWTASDGAQLGAWLAASTAHRVVFLRLDSAWQQAARLKAAGAGISPGAVPTPEELQRAPFDLASRREAEHATSNFAESHVSEFASRTEAGYRQADGTEFVRGRWRRMPRGLYVAGLCAVGLLVLLGVGYFLWPLGPAYHTGVGGLAAVPISDGSQVILNTDSRIRVDVTDTERRVNLVQGEALFEVVKDPARPFVVTAGNQRVIAVGTKFSVRRSEDGVRVVVLEGRVRVDPGDGADAKVAPAEVSAGSVARSRAGQGVLIERKPPPDIEPYVSWRTGFLLFRETPLADAVAEFNRYNEQQIVLEDPHLAGIHIDGHFRSTNVAAFVRLLEDGFPVTVKRQGERILVGAK